MLSGLPGVGKTTIARELAVVMDAVHVRIDSIEQALRHAGWTVDSEDTARLEVGGSLRIILSAVEL